MRENEYEEKKQCIADNPEKKGCQSSKECCITVTKAKQEEILGWLR